MFLSGIVAFAMSLHCGDFHNPSDDDLTKIIYQSEQAKLINYLQEKSFRSIDHNGRNITDGVADNQYIGYSMFKEIKGKMYDAYTIIDVKNKSYARIWGKNLKCY